jgi:hypothetical protein
MVRQPYGIHGIMYNVTGVFKPALMLMFTVEKMLSDMNQSDYDEAERLRQKRTTTTVKDYLDFFPRHSAIPLSLYIIEERTCLLVDSIADHTYIVCEVLVSLTWRAPLPFLIFLAANTSWFTSFLLISHSGLVVWVVVGKANVFWRGA